MTLQLVGVVMLGDDLLVPWFVHMSMQIGPILIIRSRLNTIDCPDCETVVLLWLPASRWLPQFCDVLSGYTFHFETVSDQRLVAFMEFPTARLTPVLFSAWLSVDEIADLSLVSVSTMPCSNL
jgi:hypothetical protein